MGDLCIHNGVRPEPTPSSLRDPADAMLVETLRSCQLSPTVQDFRGMASSPTHRCTLRTLATGPVLAQPTAPPHTLSRNVKSTQPPPPATNDLAL